MPGYGKLQLALPAPTVVDVHVSEYGAVTINRDEAKVAGFFVLYLDAELILVRADELHFARPLVCQRGYGMLLHVRPNLESCHVIDRHAKVVLAVYVLPAELNHVLAVAGNQTLCGRGYVMLCNRN